MPSSFKVLVAICALAFTAACATEEKVVYVEPEPVSAEQTYSKY